MYYLLIFLLIILSPLKAQISTDESFGKGHSLTSINDNYTISESLGKITGSNLFHSFNHFNLSQGESATFTGQATITNIINRVTGGNASSIDGKIISNIEGANFYFLNPAGVMFGANATLDISGSFYVSSADYLQLEEGVQFTSIPQNNEIFSTAAPSAFGFLDNGTPPAGISFLGKGLLPTPLEEDETTGLRVADKQTFAVIGGDISLANGTHIIEVEINPLTHREEETIKNLAMLQAPSGNIILTSVASAGIVNLSDTSDLSSFKALGTISAKEQALVSVNTIDNGSIVIRGGKLEISQSTFQMTGNGKIDIDVNTISLDEEAAIKTQAFFGQGADIQIVANNLTLSGKAEIAAEAFAKGNGGNIIIHADTLQGPGVSSIITQIFGGSGKVGDVTVNAAIIDSHGLSISSLNAGSGIGGNVIVEAKDIELKDGLGSAISSFVFSSGSGGDVFVTADRILLSNGGNINVLAVGGNGDAGDINIQASSVIIEGISPTSSRTGFFTSSGIFASALAQGNAGNTTISVDTLSLQQGAKIIASSGVRSDGSTKEGVTGKGGQLDITVRDTLTISGVNENGTASAISTETVMGNGGNISITANTLQLSQQGRITSQTRSIGDAGQITIDSRAIQLNDGIITTGSISTDENAGRAGNIQLLASNRLVFNHSEVTSASENSGGGNIRIDAKQLLHLINSSVTTRVKNGNDNAGNIQITPNLLVLQSSQINANAFGGSGGNITIDATALIVNPDSQIEASSQLGIDGNIATHSPDTDISGSLDVLPQTFIATDQILTNPCATQFKNSSSFVVTRYTRNEIKRHPAGILTANVLAKHTLAAHPAIKMTQVSTHPILKHHECLL